MIAFQTLLLGLVFGSVPVTVMVGPQVKSVEVRLDGTTIGVLAGEPWTIPCDFGESPHPHEVIAIARDGSGKDIGRARQWVNMPRPGAEATLLLVRSAKPNQVLAARLTWEEIKGTKPTTVHVTLDRKTLAIKDPKRFDLPPCDPTLAHILSAELVFPEGRTARADAVFGGDLGEEAQSELTGVPLVLEPGTKLPALQELQAWFHDGDVPLRVLGVEQGSFDVVLILDPAVRQVLAKERYVRRGGRDGALVPGSQSAIFHSAGRSDNRLFITYGVPEPLYRGGNLARVIFPVFEPMHFVTSKVRVRLANLMSSPADVATQTLADDVATQTLADAVATVGALAAGSNRPRAVVLLLAGSSEDASSITPAGARAYLEDMHVPLLIWSLLGGGATDDWGIAEDVSSDDGLDQATKRLKERLAAQQIVWLEGAHLPQRIRLTESVKSAHLAP